MKDLIARRKDAENRAQELAALDELTEEQQADFDAALEEVRKIDEQIRAKEERMKTVNALPTTNTVEERLEQPVRKPIRETSANPVITGTERSYDTLGDFLVAVRQASTPGQRMPELLREVQGRISEQRAGTGLQAQVPSDGGFFLQPEHEQGLLMKMHDSGQIMNRCAQRVLPYGADSIVINGVDESSRANGSRFGGVRGYWSDEAATMTASQPKFHQIKLEPQELTALYYATDKLLRNASFLQGEVEDMVAKELVFKVEDAIVNGSGAGQPLGLLNANCKVSNAVETGQTSSDPILAENISKMFALMPASLRAGAVWLVNQELEPYMDKMNFAVGTGGQLVYMPQGGISEAPFARLKGLPVIPVEFCAAPNTEGDIILANLSEYLLCRRGSVLGASSIHVQFLTNQTVFRFLMEVDGQPRWKDALTPYKGSNDVSPIVTLAARS